MPPFQPGIKMSVFVLLFLPLLISLGFWQVDRGAQKRELQMQFIQQTTQLPRTLQPGAPTEAFQRVKLNGVYTDRYFLIDNQVRAGQVGYWVVQVFEQADGSEFLVNRGFVAAPDARELLPQLEYPVQTVDLVGLIWPFTGLLPLLDEDPWPHTWPKRVQRMDLQRMASVTAAPPLEIRLESGQPGVASAAPMSPLLSDEKHLGYAATWFGLAIVLTIGYLVFGFKQGRGE